MYRYNHKTDTCIDWLKQPADDAPPIHLHGRKLSPRTANFHANYMLLTEPKWYLPGVVDDE